MDNITNIQNITALSDIRTFKKVLSYLYECCLNSDVSSNNGNPYSDTNYLSWQIDYLHLREPNVYMELTFDMDDRLYIYLIKDGDYFRPLNEKQALSWLRVNNQKAEDYNVHTHNWNN